MTARGEPLAPLAAATSSPETAQLIALQSLVLAGEVDVMEAARMNVAATGGDTALLDRLHQRVSQPVALVPRTSAAALSAASIPEADSNDESIHEDAEDHEDELGPVPSMRYSAKRITARLEATR